MTALAVTSRRDALANRGWVVMSPGPGAFQLWHDDSYYGTFKCAADAWLEAAALDGGAEVR